MNKLDKAQFRYLGDSDKICRIQHDRGRYVCNYTNLSLHFCVHVGDADHNENTSWQTLKRKIHFYVIQTFSTKTHNEPFQLILLN